MKEEKERWKRKDETRYNVQVKEMSTSATCHHITIDVTPLLHCRSTKKNIMLQTAYSPIHSVLRSDHPSHLCKQSCRSHFLLNNALNHHIIILKINKHDNHSISFALYISSSPIVVSMLKQNEGSR